MDMREGSMSLIWVKPVGRKADIEKIKEKLGEDEKPLVIVGEEEIGKTVICQMLIEECVKQQREVQWVDYHKESFSLFITI